MTTPLCPAELLILSGPDAAAFAHAQFTNDVAALRPGTWQWSAWLDAHGRVRSFFALLRTESARLVLWLPLGGAPAMRDALARFVLRATVKLEVETDWTLHRLEGPDITAPIAAGVVAMRDGGFAFLQPGEPARVAWIARVGTPSMDADAMNSWRLADIAARLPLLAPAASGEFVAQALDLERLDAIRFDKGCYPGQEIVARLHFRGGNKRHLHRVRVDAAPPSFMTPIVDEEGKAAGHLLYAALDPTTRTGEAIAVLADDSTSRRLVAATANISIRV